MAQEQWHPEIEVTEALAKTCIYKQCKELLPITSITCIGEGWDNKVFLVNNTIVFRFPHRQVAAQLIERENKVLDYLHNIININIPYPRYKGHSSAHYPYPFQGYPIIPGISGCHANLTPTERSNSLIPLAHFLKQLHSITEKQAQAIGAAPPIFDRTNTGRLITTLTERVDKIIARNIIGINQRCFQAEINLAKNITLHFDDKVLIHGDLYCPHLLFLTGKLHGIIDWGDTGINHRSIDLSIIFSFYPQACHSSFFDIYGEVDAATLQHARFVALHIMLTILLYAHDRGDSLLVLEACESIKRINAELLVEKSGDIL